MGTVTARNGNDVEVKTPDGKSLTVPCSPGHDVFPQQAEGRWRRPQGGGAGRCRRRWRGGHDREGSRAVGAGPGRRAEISESPWLPALAGNLPPRRRKPLACNEPQHGVFHRRALVRVGPWPHAGSIRTSQCSPSAARIVTCSAVPGPVVFTLDDERGTVEAGQERLDIPRRNSGHSQTASNRRTSAEPDPWWRASRSGRSHAITSGGTRDTLDRQLLDEHVRRLEDEPSRTDGPRPAAMIAIEAPSLWPTKIASWISNAWSTCGSTTSASSCMKQGERASAAVRGAVAGAAVDEAAAPGAGADPSGKSRQRLTEPSPSCRNTSVGRSAGRRTYPAVFEAVTFDPHDAVLCGTTGHPAAQTGATPRVFSALRWKCARRDAGGDGMTSEQKLALYYWMQLARTFDERMLLCWKQGRGVGGAFSGRGHEAISVGCAYALGPDDVVTPMHRDIGAYLLRGLTPRDVFGNLLGRQTGPSRGRDANLHGMSRLDLGIIGYISHLPHSMPVALGAAMSFLYRGEPRVAMTFTGDGGSKPGCTRVAEHGGRVTARWSSSSRTTSTRTRRRLARRRRSGASPATPPITGCPV